MKKDLKKNILIGIGVFFVLVLGTLLVKKVLFSNYNPNSVEIDWRLLGEMDYVSGTTASAELKAVDGQEVKLPGFMVPLEDNSKSVTEFLLVPSPQACIHVPPPPPNQMVYVKMDGSEKTEVAYGPIWVYAKLRMTVHKHMYGESSFEMVGHHIEPYK